jgi:hypothetical protein
MKHSLGSALAVFTLIAAFASAAAAEPGKIEARQKNGQTVYKFVSPFELCKRQFPTAPNPYEICDITLKADDIPTDENIVTEAVVSMDTRPGTSPHILKFGVLTLREAFNLAYHMSFGAKREATVVATDAKGEVVANFNCSPPPKRYCFSAER